MDKIVHTIYLWFWSMTIKIKLIPQLEQVKLIYRWKSEISKKIARFLN